MSDATSLHRLLKIKAGAAKRLMKENRLYQKEEESLKQKLDKFIADGAENWDIKNTRNMMEESHRLVEDTAKRLGGATQDLREAIVRHPSIPFPTSSIHDNNNNLFCLRSQVRKFYLQMT
ncbi:tubulin binding cofactor A [Abortiporus biennis]|nr:tubulin binding cofactor A [Abortiporus biennis]